MSCAWKCAGRAVTACLAGVVAWLAAGAVRAEAGETNLRHDAVPEARLARLSESLAQCAFDALAAAAWADGVSPTLVLPPGLAEEIDAATATALLSRARPERPAGAWQALRLGRTRPLEKGSLEKGSLEKGPFEGRPSHAPPGSPPPMAPPLAYPSTDLDLERACQLLVCESLAAMLPPDTRLPADLMRDLLSHAPIPPTNPSADPALARRVQRLERAGRLSRSARVEADRIVAEFEATRTAADQWRARHDALLARIASLADGEEGRALVWLARRVQSARGGWSAPEQAREGSRSARAADEVARSIRKAVSEGQSCYALAEALVALEPVRTARIDSLAVSGEGRLRVGRSVATVSQDSIDAWRRACGLQRSAVGWTGLSARPRPRPPKIRDAPFGIKPL